MEGKKSTVAVNGSCFGGRMHLVELPLPQVIAREVKLSMELRTGGKTRRPALRQKRGPGKRLTLKYSWNMKKKTEGSAEGLVTEKKFVV